MKKIVVCMLVLFCSIGISNAFAGEHLANVIWTSNGFLVGYDSTNNAAPVYVNQIDLDIGVTEYYYTANGVILTTDGWAQGCTGTGFTDDSDDIIIDLQCGTSQVVLSINGRTLNGQVDVIDYRDQHITSRQIYFQSLE